MNDRSRYKHWSHSGKRREHRIQWNTNTCKQLDKCVKRVTHWPQSSSLRLLENNEIVVKNKQHNESDLDTLFVAQALRISNRRHFTIFDIKRLVRCPTIISQFRQHKVKTFSKTYSFPIWNSSFWYVWVKWFLFDSCLQFDTQNFHLSNRFDFSLQSILIALAVLAIVSAVPVDETVVGDVYGQDDSVSPQDPSEFIFKLKKLKKLLFG